MTIGFPSVRVDDANPLHHLWCNNGTWWVHYTLHFDFRRRRIRRSLGTRRIEEAIRRRDELLARLARDGEPVAERRPAPTVAADGARQASRQGRPSVTPVRCAGDGTPVGWASPAGAACGTTRNAECPGPRRELVWR